MNTYTLKGTEPVPCEDLFEWARWFERTDRRVAFTEFKNGVQVSTVFLGIDHNFMSEIEPLLFETCVFYKEGSEVQSRYYTWDEALKGHEELIEELAKTLGEYTYVPVGGNDDESAASVVPVHREDESKD